MKPTHIEHIGIAVKDLQEAIRIYKDLLGTDCYKIEEVPGQKVVTAFFRVGETKIELLASTDPEGPVGKFIEKRGEGIHHIAFAVDSVNECLGELITKGVHLIDRVPGEGADGLDIAFVHPKSTAGVLVEICGKSSDSGNKHI